MGWDEVIGTTRVHSSEGWEKCEASCYGDYGAVSSIAALDCGVQEDADEASQPKAETPLRSHTACALRSERVAAQ
ncbi:hypothetical protein NDU88_007508 [Pleurodeles waltl]|uniref:Uncharacterized protein n=1 Tax=Pleurodeles waltl TaxID=8319 RepID=A0AAV7U1C2_PLEWA|nr:hypothetical protein NDU88_007508 [Pleurodeles waltl]